MIEVEGKCGIRAVILAHSISPQGIPLITFELEYPRIILAELNTHRMLSKNSFSSRAVPFNKMVEQLTGRPVRFGANQPGMQDKGEDHYELVDIPMEDVTGEYFLCCGPEAAWLEARERAIEVAEAYYKAGYHKQVYNRLLEPFQMMKTVLSATELSNFWWLRDDLAADPTLAELARCMREAMGKSTPVELKPGEWHLPYLDWIWYSDGNGGRKQVFYIGEVGEGVQKLTLEEAIKVSCARCAAVSYRNQGYGLEKSLEVYDKLVGSDKKHASAFEHQATPMSKAKGSPMAVGGLGRVNHHFNPDTWEEGITHVDRKGQLWSGNFKGWRQYRKLITGENYEGT